MHQEQILACLCEDKFNGIYLLLYYMTDMVSAKTLLYIITSIELHTMISSILIAMS